MALVDFFYDEQIRRFLLQFTRMFSGFQVEFGRDDNGNPTYATVPVRYGDASRQAATIIANNSANSIPCAPQMTFYIDSIAYARNRVQEPYFVDSKSVRQRTWDAETQTYETTEGNAFTVKRHMPVPYDLTLKLDIWTTNTNQKWQLFEQIVPMFNPALEIQSTDSYYDWTSLSVVELNDVNYSSRQIPVGNEDPIDIMSLTFTLPVWISMPAKVLKLGVIHTVIASIYDQDQLDYIAENDDFLLGTRMRITPHGYKTLLIDNQLQILRAKAVDEPDTDLSAPEMQTDSTLTWQPVIEEYGQLRNGISQMRLRNADTGTEIIGTISYHPVDDRILLIDLDIDTLPENTLDPVLAVIDPLRSGPGEGLPVSATGQRYLLTDDIGAATNNPAAAAWGPLVAKANDIIEYSGSNWFVSFDAAASESHQYVTNLNTDLQYKWDHENWLRSYEGLYEGGDWALVL